MKKNQELKNLETERASTEDIIAELVKRGASMEQIALLKDPIANTPNEALLALKTGNARFYAGSNARQQISVNERRAQIISQTPFAVVLGCSDSRVPLEIVFDQGPGDLFSIRVAGHVIEPATLGSIEYAIRHLKIHLVVVLGHEGCGAVAAAMLEPEKRDQEPEYVRFLLDKITPAVCDLPPIRDHKARMREAVVANVWHQKAALEENPVVKSAIEKGQLKVVGAFYEIGSGAVDFLDS